MKEINLSKIDSTNTYAKEHAEEFEKDGITCITAEEQTAGRGRFERRWISPKGVNIYATFYFTLPKKTPDLISLSQVMALSFAYVLQQKKLNPEIKWPNDIRLNGKKLAGILCETRFLKETVEIFLGIGINVNLDQTYLDQIDQPATSLKAATGKEWDKKALLKELQEQFKNDLFTLKKQGFKPFHEAFETLLAMKGERVRCFDGEKVLEGTLHSIRDDGQLNLQLEDGSIKTILSGDVTTPPPKGGGF